MSKARLTGYLLSSNKWISFIDGDDKLEKNMYEKLIKNASKYNANISHCGYKTIVNNGERIHYFHNTGKLVIQDNEKGLFDLLDGSYVEPGLFNKIYKKDLVEKCNFDYILNENIEINEDLLMNYELFKKTNHSVYEDICLYCYNSRPSSVTRSGFSLKKVSDTIKAKKWILDNSKETLKDTALSKYLSACGHAYINSFNKTGCNEFSKSIRKEVVNYKEFWKVLSKKEKAKLYCEISIPHIYVLLYNIYSKYFQNKVYE